MVVLIVFANSTTCIYDCPGLKSAGDTVSGGVSSKSKPSASQIAQGKHPVSALQEICQKRHWGGPQYHSVGPSNNTAFLFKVQCVCVYEIVCVFVHIV